MATNIDTNSLPEYVVMANSSAAYPLNLSVDGEQDSPPPSEAGTIYPSAIILVVLSFFTIVLCLPAFAWHIKNRNLAASSMVFWILFVNLFNIINPLIWPSDDIENWWHGQGYCDIAIKLDIAATMGLVGSLACIFRSLATALDSDRVRICLTSAQRRRQALIETLLCFGFPLLIATLHFIVQPNRYYIYAIAGCVPSYSDSWLSIILGYMWPLIIILIAGYYATMVIIRMIKYRRQFASVLSATTSGMTKSRFTRLMLAASILLLACLPVQIYVFVLNMAYPITGFSWSETHDPARWQTFILVPTAGVVYPDRWIRAPLGLPVFLCFGLGPEAKALYRSWLLTLGFGHFFPSLDPEYRRPANRPVVEIKTSSAAGSESSFGSKARLFFSRQASRCSIASIKRSLGGTVTTATVTTANSPASPTDRSFEMNEFLNADQQLSEQLPPSGPTSSTHRSTSSRMPLQRLRTAITGKQQTTGSIAVSSEEAMRKAQRQKEYEGVVVGALT